VPWGSDFISEYVSCFKKFSENFSMQKKILKNSVNSEKNFKILKTF